MPRIYSDQAEMAIQERGKPSLESRRVGEAMPPTSPTTLIMDDDRDIRESLNHLLTQEGYRVTAVGHGAEAIQQVKEERYGAALLDIHRLSLRSQMPDAEFPRRSCRESSIPSSRPKSRGRRPAWD